MKKLLTCLTYLTLSSQLLTASPVVGAYYENWSQYRPPSGGRMTFFPEMIDPTIITDLYFAFGIFGYVSKSIDPDNPHLTGDFTIQPVEWNDQSTLYPQVMALKKTNPNLRNILAIGGWSFNDPSDVMGKDTYKLFSKMVSSESSRSNFIESAIAYAHKYGFDGIDIDWEYPGDLTRGGAPEDFENFVLFLKECKSAFQKASPSLLLTYASPAIVPSGAPDSYKKNPDTFFKWLATCAPYLDRFNLMAYDYHGPFDSPKVTGVNAPLNRDTNPDSLMYITNSVQNYLKNGVPANKIVLGMPVYGHSYSGVSTLTTQDNGPGKTFTGPGPAGPSSGSPGLLTYFEIADKTAGSQLIFATDSLTSTAYAYNIATQEWVSFDTPDTIALTVEYALKQKLLGGMFWAIDDDEYQWGSKYPNVRKGYSLFYPSLQQDQQESEKSREKSSSVKSSEPT